MLRNLSKEGDAINALVDLLAASPTDIESWAELADLYISQGLYQQAEFCLEEILLSTPNAWNVYLPFNMLQSFALILMSDSCTFGRNVVCYRRHVSKPD